MFTKGNVIYSEAYRYLRRNGVNMVALRATGATEDYTEETFSLPLKVSVEGRIVKFGDYFIVKVPKKLSYADIKMAVIKMRYSNDDQMALILNKDDTDEDAMLYEKMQQWREFAAEVARKAVEKICITTNN